MKQQAVIILAIVFAAAERIFKNHKNIDEIFMTSDGQGFTSENKAESHAKYLPDKTVKKYYREAMGQNKKVETAKEPESKETYGDDKSDESVFEKSEDKDTKKPKTNKSKSKTNKKK